MALPGRDYDIRIGPGLLTEAGAHVAPLLRRPKVAIITEERVAGLHLATLEAGLAAAGIACRGAGPAAGRGHEMLGGA